MNSAVLAVSAILIISCTAQRSPYAGRSPVGYPAIVRSTTTADPIGNRLGDDTPITTVRLPIEARGDLELYNRLLKLPIDQQPFWLINWQALEDNRNNPQTYVSRGNEFIDTNVQN